MREIETRGVALKTTSRAFRPLASVVATLLALLQGACGGGGGVSGPSAIGGPVDRLSLSGTWRGGSTNESLVWQLKQEGDAITGSGTIARAGRWTGNGGKVVGTLSGSSFRFHESHAVGTTSVTGCSVEVEGVLQVRVEVVSSPPPPGPPPGPPSPTPGRYGPYPAPYQPSTTTRMLMSGSVSGRGCGGDLNTEVTLFKD